MQPVCSWLCSLCWCINSWISHPVHTVFVSCICVSVPLLLRNHLHVVISLNNPIKITFVVFFLWLNRIYLFVLKVTQLGSNKMILQGGLQRVFVVDKLRDAVWLYCLCLCFKQPPVAKKDPNAVSMAHLLKRGDSKTETHTNGSEVHGNIMNASPQVNKKGNNTSKQFTQLPLVYCLFSCHRLHVHYFVNSL